MEKTNKQKKKTQEKTQGGTRVSTVCTLRNLKNTKLEAIIYMQRIWCRLVRAGPEHTVVVSVSFSELCSLDLEGLV